MTEIVAHVVSAEWEHRHRVATHPAEDASRGGGCFRSHGSAHVDARRPVESLVNQGHGRRPAPTKNDGADGYSVGFLPVGVDGRTLACGRGETPVGMGRWSCGC